MSGVLGCVLRVFYRLGFKVVSQRVLWLWIMRISRLALRVVPCG